MPAGAGTIVAMAESKNNRGRGGGLNTLARSLSRVTKPLLKGRSRAETGLILDWPDVAGPEIARLCRPLSVSFPQRDRRDGGCLKLLVAGGHGLEIQHLVPQILARVNAYLGYRAVAEIRIKQSAWTPASVQQAAASNVAPESGQASPNAVDPTRREALEALPEGPLRTALEDLAQAREREKAKRRM